MNGNMEYTQNGLPKSNAMPTVSDDQTVEKFYNGDAFYETVEDEDEKDVVKYEPMDHVMSEVSAKVAPHIETAEDVNTVMSVGDAVEHNKSDLDDSYVLANFDVLFDSLYNDVTGANNFISDLVDRKNTLNKNEKVFAETKEKFEKEKKDFENYVSEQHKAVALDKRQADEYIENQKIRLQGEQLQFNMEVESTRTELNLLEQTLGMEKDQLAREREQFAKYKQLEEERLKNDKEKFEAEKNQFFKERENSQESIKNGLKDLQNQREQFAKYKELEEKKLELESKNLTQSCARFKDLVSQFNSGVSQLPDKE